MLNANVDTTGLLTTEDVAARLGIGYNAVTVAVHRNALPSLKVKGRRYFRPEDVAAYAARRGGKRRDQELGEGEGRERK